MAKQGFRVTDSDLHVSEPLGGICRTAWAAEPGAPGSGQRAGK